MATSEYNTSKGSLSQRFVHLTNFSVNKKSSNYVPNKNSADSDPSVTSKWSFKQLKQEYQKLGIDYDQVFDRIKDVIIKTLLSVETHIVTNMK